MVWLALLFVAVMALALPHAYLTIGGEDPDTSATSEADSAPAEASAAPLRDALSAAQTPAQRLAVINHLAVGLLVMLAIPFWIEAILRLTYIERGGVVSKPSRGRASYILCCAIIPPLRTGLHPASLRGHMWLPIFGWRRTSGRLARRVQRTFGVPMLGIGLLILPVLLGEIFFSRQVAQSPGLALGMDAATRLIWFAFALEFIVMMAVTPRRTEYALRHWVDLVIILLPFVAFLRSLQVLRAGQVLKAQRVSQFARVYRLRGVAVKLLQAVLLLRVLEGFSEGAARRRISSLRHQIRFSQTEVKELQHELRDVRKQLAERKRKQLEKRRRRRRRQIPTTSGAGPTSIETIASEPTTPHPQT